MPKRVRPRPRWEVKIGCIDERIGALSNNCFSKSEVCGHRGQARHLSAIAAKVAELTAIAKSESDRIRAIARYIQDIRYVSIQTGLGRGGGYLPHAASEVFSRSYGDCKDKATLMRAMLKAAGIQSYSVAIYSLASRYVREEWPSPQQFDHVIVAIAVHADSFPTTALTHPQFGRLLFFDPTDPDTGCGDLPEDEQGSLALLAAPQGGSLIRTPSSAPDANLIERQIEVTLDGQGAIVGRIQEQAKGQAGASYRQEYRANPGSKYKEVLESWIAGSVNGAQISKFTPVKESGDGTFATEIEFSANDYGQLMQNRLLIFRPVLVSRRDKLSLTERSRTSPVVLEPHAFTERSRFKLPEGFAVEEPPAAVQFDAPFGTYAANVEVRQGDVLFTRRLVLKGQIIPVDQYTTLRKFFENIRTAEQAPVVLVRK